MPTPIIQTSFHAGEWAPALNARVDLSKYHAAAATLRNFFVDYRGGASSRPGTKYIIRAYKSATAVRLISFQASFTVSYVLEFGDGYIRFITNGAAVLETAIALTAATAASPGVFTKNAHGLNTGDWIYTTLFAGGTWSTINGKYYIVAAATANTFQLTDLYGVAISTAGLGIWSAGSVARVYTLPSPYTATELSTIKFAQNVNTLVLCQTNHAPYILTLISANNWTLIPIVFGSTIGAPTGMGAATTTAGIANYSYVVTAGDIMGQESIVSAVTSSTVTTVGLQTITVSWTAVSGAQSYNVYRAGPSIAGVVPTGSAFGFASNVTGVSFADIFSLGLPVVATDYAIRIPVARNPFQGAGVASATVTASGAALAAPVPTITFAAAPAGGVTATGSAIAGVQGTPTVPGGGGGSAYAAGQILAFPNGVSVVIATVNGAGTVLTYQPITFPGSNPGAIASGAAIPGNPVTSLTLSAGATATANFNWGINSINIINSGAGYVAAPAITFSAGAAAATSVLGTASNGSPTVPIYYDQRLWLAGPAGSPQQFDASQPGAPYNFNVTDPVQPNNAFEGTLVSSKLNTIKSMLGMPSGLVMLSDQQAWLINGGSNSSAPTAIDIRANQHAYNGASDVPPILANFDILYVQAKGSIVRDLTYNFYTNIFTGTDISVLSSHLFYGYTVLEWAWAEEPFKVVWAVRNDGTMLTLTFLKEQELIGWAHSDTSGLFKSVCTVTEAVSFGNVDAVYTVIERAINGQTVKYIERVAERIFVNGATDAWCVDAGLQYSGAPATNFSGGEHLAGATVTGLADGVVITPFVMAGTGNFTLTNAASKVTVGLAFSPQLQTLAIDVGNPTVQGQPKKIAGVTVRVQETLGLSIGTELTNQIAMKDLVVGNVSSMLTGKTNQTVTGLVTGDGFQIPDPTYTINGQYYITQPFPLPATILGVIPILSGGKM